MIQKGMTPEQIKEYRIKSGLATQPQIRKIDGVKGAVPSTWEDVASASKNTIWTEGNSHALLSNGKGSVRIKGDKKDKFGILNNVNTAVVHIKSVSATPTTREVNTMNKQLKQIRDMGFDTPKIATNRYGETIVYAKRKLFTKDF